MCTPAQYILAHNKALKLITELTRHDLVILQVLAFYNCPIAYVALYDATVNCYGMISYTTFDKSLKHLAKIGAIKREAIKDNITHTITMQGNKLLTDFNYYAEIIAAGQVTTRSR